MFAPQINPFESIMFGKGGEVNPPFATMPYLGGGKMEAIGPYIPSDENRGVELFGGDNRMAALGVGFPHTNVRNYDGKILPYMGGTRPTNVRPKGSASLQARANSANPHSTFIRDPGGSGKAIKFNYPLDLRGVEDKLKVFPFTQIKAQQGDSFRPAGMIFSA